MKKVLGCPETCGGGRVQSLPTHTCATPLSCMYYMVPFFRCCKWKTTICVYLFFSHSMVADMAYNMRTHFDHPRALSVLCVRVRAYWVTMYIPFSLRGLLSCTIAIAGLPSSSCTSWCGLSSTSRDVSTLAATRGSVRPRCCSREPSLQPCWRPSFGW